MINASVAMQHPHDNMVIRPAQRSDLTPAAKVCAKAFFDTELFGEVIHPYRHQYPDDMHLYWLKNFRSGLKRRDNHILVATVSEPEESQPTVVGVAQWIRRRAQPYIQDQPSSSASSSEQNGAAEELDEELPPNRAADPAKLDVLQRVGPFVDHKWSGKRAETWYLGLLAIHPDYQGHGIGKRLVAWGFDRAKADAVCVSVISALGKDGFYRGCGFDVDVGYATEGEGNPLSGVPGGLIMFRDQM
ncbi:hypothetical protein KC343_g2896 [Hortaea werneckii]|uniref:N-acetyltransferase domain-containing protein n=2 Tax=Hortaea werneckii TaxID=91943 RepID=A0A3M7HLD6_HORWE|nr:hypothetical protein KC352_g20629 [Hortaea werneckii]KAI7357717.1 hypothetical protein KC320_g1647 [Hortaea werneckii]KAI7563365.1 hypothetical protein KC317_g7780 [Hortaea werneckii]KAI7623113.1 hypothetical protein KC346_g2887 [Hortaea werneckii]KAI7633506.1 hypothetical protein KC343_g2896 [Hortaea werneckii]